ncbi:MAG: hypothetical protein E7290_06110 [Lachnospiraceae bacterium]|nr:hypothetical protein [Lachnospiraceae bacterium]
MMIFLVEALVLCSIFTVLILLSMKKPLEAQIYSYPPNIIHRVAKMGLIEKMEKPRVVEVLKRKWPAIIVFGAVIGIAVYYLNDANTFLKAFAISYGLWFVVDWYDAIVLDIGWFCHSKRVRIPGTEDMIEDYQDYWFHIKASLVGMLLGLPTCLIAGAVCRILA